MTSVTPAPPRADAERIGILLINSGTPEAPEPAAVRRFLARFLADPRVVELPRALWLPLLYGVVLPFRPRRIAHKYRQIWTSSGSPLRDLSERLAAELRSVLAQRVLAPLSVEVGMLYSAPQLQAALTRLRDSGAQRILALPLFPQYCAATTGAAFDAVSAVLRGWRRLPDVQFVAGYHDHPGYIEALRASVAEHWQAHGRTAHLLMSFHGIPERNVRAGDPYLSQCQNTARLLADELLLREGEWSVSFQSRFGTAELAEAVHARDRSRGSRRAASMRSASCVRGSRWTAWRPSRRSPSRIAPPSSPPAASAMTTCRRSTYAQAMHSASLT